MNNIPTMSVEEEVFAKARQIRSLYTDTFTLPDLIGNPNDVLMLMCDSINKQLDVIFKESERDELRVESVRLKWLNIRSKLANPDGRDGFFRIAATRKSKE